MTQSDLRRREIKVTNNVDKVKMKMGEKLVNLVTRRVQ